MESSGINFDLVFSAGNTRATAAAHSVSPGWVFFSNETMSGKSPGFVLTSGLSCRTCQIKALASAAFTFLSLDL